MDAIETAAFPIVLLVTGGLALWWGGDKLVDHAARLARSYRVPKHLVGAIILGFGTSLPELLVCLRAVVTDDPGIAIGNVVGSNIANVGLILGVAAVISPIVVERKLIAVDLPLGLLGAGGLALWIVAFDGAVTPGVGLALLAAFALYFAFSVGAARAHRRTSTEEVPERRLLVDGGWIVAGLVMVAVGAVAFVAGGKQAAELLGVPQEVIGLSVVALGTSLPELVTTVAAARHGHPELAVGNVAGSNLFNLLFVLGTTASLGTIPISPAVGTDLLVATAMALLALPILARARSIPRYHGVLLLLIYTSYMAWLFLQGRAAPVA